MTIKVLIDCVILCMFSGWCLFSVQYNLGLLKALYSEINFSPRLSFWILKSHSKTLRKHHQKIKLVSGVFVSWVLIF